jgi:hypothetical protein
MSKWISVKFQLHPEITGVLVATNGGKVTAAMWVHHNAINELNPEHWNWQPYLSSDNEGQYGFDFDDNEDVTHWMKLPNPPNKERRHAGPTASNNEPNGQPGVA